jgi:hypothetical protein
MFSCLNRTILFLSIIFLLAGCSRLEKTESEKIRKRNCKGEYIYRSQSDVFSPITSPIHTPRASYPWEAEAHLPRITKEFFRCKGSLINPPILDFSDPSNPTPCADCDGGVRHGLPTFLGKEGVYPILTDLLNYLQKKTGKRVIITCGHRCPAHNTYADPSKENRTSKHQVGAEVDFYVQGMEDHPQEIVGLLMQYYQEESAYQNQKEYQTFQRYDKPDAHVAIQPWLNKEIYIKLNQKDEGRDGDNRHPHPYITIQVRYDRIRKERVTYDWERANKNSTRG